MVAGVLASALVTLPGCRPEAPGAGDGEALVDVTHRAGPAFRHANGMTGDLYFSEIMGPGAAFIDYDRDGDLDVYIGQGHALGPEADRPSPEGDRLFRNDPVSGPNGESEPRFVDVTEEAGLSARGYAMGVAVGDYDDDGWPDLYITNHGSNQLWRNGGDGTFSDVTAAAGADDARWSTSASFLDFDGDGLLDLFVVNYVKYRIASHKTCLTTSGLPDYCGPQSYEGEPDRLLRNRGDGTFRDVSWEAGILEARASGLGVATGDFDGDGDPDVYVANDLAHNQLWLNQGDGSFRDEALLAGVAVNMAGVAEASMGVEADDFDGDGDLDLFMTHLTGETNTLYRNAGGGLFADESTSSHLGAPSLAQTGFGVAAVDVDNDGWVDLFVANGAVKRIVTQLEAEDPFPLRQANQLFRNLGDGTFAAWSPEPPALAELEVSRAVAAGDVDNDGDADLLVANNSGSARLLMSAGASRADWVGLELRRAGGGGAALGTTVVARRAGGGTRTVRVRTDGSFCAARDPRPLIGMGGASALDSLRIIAPDGSTTVWVRPPSGARLVGRVGGA